MKDKKLQVFVSSTYSDLKEERQAAVEAILSSGHIPAGMELFSAGDETQLAVIKRWIDESDVYLLIIGGRYGSVETASGKSYTQLEYEYAVQQKKPLFSVVISETALDKKIREGGVAFIERDNGKLLNSFRATVLNTLVKFWDEKKDIKLAIYETISEFSYRKEMVGWIRGDNSVNTGKLAEEIIRLTKENAELTERLKLSNDNPFYSGLTYEQLEGLLKKNEIEIEGKKSNLFEFLMETAKFYFYKAKIPVEMKEGLNQLADYKICNFETREGNAGGLVRYNYGFTNDGHNFYLKALVRTQQ